MPATSKTAPSAGEFDVAVIGAGPAGLSAACLFADAGLKVALLGPAGSNDADARTSALLMGAVRMLRRLGVWSALEADAAPLKVMRIIDRLSRPDHSSAILFESAEIGPEPFGYNLPNAPLCRALEARFAGFADTTRIPAMVSSVDHSDRLVRISASSASATDARLVVAADGRNSSARDAAGISATVWDYHQSAIAARIVHEREHGGTSTEFHRPGGPFTTVPLPGKASAIVWLDRPDTIDHAMALDETGLNRAIEDETQGLLGRVRIARPCGRFAVRGLATTTLARARTVLIGEAAHVVPPIGAQGLNLGLRDAAWIAEIAAAGAIRGDDPGGEPVLARYRAVRRAEIGSRRAISDMLNRSLLLDSSVLRGLRGLGLTALATIGPLRRGVMRAGLGHDSDLPQIMRAGAG